MSKTLGFGRSTSVQGELPVLLLSAQTCLPFLDITNSWLLLIPGTSFLLFMTSSNKRLWVQSEPFAGGRSSWENPRAFVSYEADEAVKPFHEFEDEGVHFLFVCVIIQLDNAGNAQADFVSSKPEGFILPQYGFHALKISFQASLYLLEEKGGLAVFNKDAHLLSAAAIARSSFISVETNSCTAFEGRISSFKYWTLSSDNDCNRFAPLVIVFATSNARIYILFPLDPAAPEINPLLFKFVMLLPNVSRTSTAFSRPTMLAFPRKELT
nr:hypothetical protein Iba_chr01fCG3200 [Ipomoea batatas]